MACHFFTSKLVDVPPPPEPKSRPRTTNTNKKHVDQLLGLAQIPAPVLRQRVVLFGDSWFERFTYEGRNNGVGPFAEQVRSCADQVDVCAVGGDKVSNALWRSGEGGAVDALGAAAMAAQTDVFVLLGINDIAARALGKKGAGKGLEMDMDTGSDKVVSDVAGGVYALAGELKAGLKSEITRIHILEVPLLPMYALPGNEGMREEAENINDMLQKLGAEAGFKVHGWDPCLLDERGTVMPRWLISRNDVHLNAEGYDLFARYLRSLIMQKDSERVGHDIEKQEDSKVTPAQERKNRRGRRERPRVQGGWS